MSVKVSASSDSRGLVAPVRVVVDEAGNPHCAADPKSKSKGGFLVGAIAIPDVLVGALLPILPRDRNGRLLKSSSRDLSPTQLVDFLHALPIDLISIAIVAIATNSETNASISARCAEVANYWRKLHHRPRIAMSSLLRLTCDNEAILNAWALHSSRQLVDAKKRRIAAQRIHTPHEDWVVRPGDLEAHVSFMSVTIDEGNHTLATRRDAPGWFQEALHRRHVIARPYQWASEVEEPLLAIPDLLTGMILRHAERRDLLKAMAWLNAAWKSGRIWMQDGKTTQVPELPKQSVSTAVGN